MTDVKEKVAREHKDRLFNFIFGSEENKKWTLQLYNAINGSDYQDENLIQFNTLENVLFMGMGNDTSFIISNIMSIYEHQSSYNRNMPLRLLQYADELYTGYIAINKLNKYGSKLIMLPVPRLLVFYNGVQEAEDETILRLSDSFPEELRDTADIEVKVRMININYGHNKKLLEACKPLDEYAWLINEIRKNQKEHGLQTSVKMALEDMPKDFLIREFLVTNQKEVQGMLDTEYKEAEVMELFKEEGRAEGIEEGIEKGREEGIEKGKDDLNLLNSILISLGRIDDLKRSVHDREFQQKLFDELLPNRKAK